MASSIPIRALRPLTRQAIRLNSTTTTQLSVSSTSSYISRRAASTASTPILYSAHAKVVGARTGHAKGEDLDIGLTTAKALGGPGDEGKTNPEELFAAGYGACFQAAMNASAPLLGLKMPQKPEDSVIDTTVYLVGNIKERDMQLRVHMDVKVKGLTKEELDKIVEKAKAVCPYSRATEGNVYTTIECATMN